MANLTFRYGAMNSGKSTALMQVAHNYEEKNMKVIVLKPVIDTKGNDKLVSRVGIMRKVDYLVSDGNSIIKLLKDKLKDTSCILVDEAQFLTEKHVDELHFICKELEIPVICYGLRSDFKTNSFPGSRRLFELADKLEELTTICACGKKAKFNARVINGKYVFEGEQVAIDEVDDVYYESLCGKCYIEKVHNFVKQKRLKKH